MPDSTEQTRCPCGCGRDVTEGKKFAAHGCASHFYKTHPRPPKTERKSEGLCPCGCRQPVMTGNRFATSGCCRRGKSPTLETLARISAGVRRVGQDPIHRLVLSEAQRKVAADPQYKAHQMEAQKTKWTDPVYRAAMVEKQKKAWNDPALRQKHMEIKQSPEYKARIAAKVAMVWSDPAYKTRVAPHMSAANKLSAQNPVHRANRAAAWANRDKPSGFHISVKAALDAAGIVTITHLPVGYYIVDEADPIKKVAVEMQGCYWHSCSVCGCHGPKVAVARDKSRRTYLKNHGWTLIEIWEHEWKSDPVACVGKVRAAINLRRLPVPPSDPC